MVARRSRLAGEPGNFADGRASSSSQTLDEHSDTCPPISKFVRPNASQGQIDNAFKLHRICGGGIYSESTTNSTVDDELGIEKLEKESKQTKLDAVLELPDPKESTEEEYNDEFTSDDVFEVRMIRIGQLEDQIKGIDPTFLKPESQKIILKQFDEAKYLIKKDELALAYHKLNEIDYGLINNDGIAKKLTEETNSVNKIFSEVPSKPFTPSPCEFGDKKTDGVCSFDYSVIFIPLVVGIIIALVLWKFTSISKNKPKTEPLN